MRKIISLSFLFLFTIVFTACNNNDDEIEELQNQINALQNQSNTQTGLVSASAPITVDFSGNRKFDSAAVSFSANYNYSWETENSAGEFSQAAGVYSINVWRSTAVADAEDAEIEISNYNPANGINAATIYVNFEKYLQPADTNAVLYIEQTGYRNHGSGTTNTTVNSFSFNPTTRAFSIDLTINATENTPQNTTDNPTNTRVRFSGTLSSDQYVYKQAGK